jgi:SPP1 gp7 family putative phage head morphogenesis protein
MGAARLVMTESAHFANEGMAAAFGELGIGEYEFIAAAEGDTCKTCGHLDSMVFTLREKKAGINFSPDPSELPVYCGAAR